jgi:hypothetical protein
MVAVPRNKRTNITLLAALSLQGMGEAFILEGSADTCAGYLGYPFKKSSLLYPMGRLSCQSA